MVYIYTFWSLSLFRRYLYNRILPLFIIWLFHVIFPFNHNLWMINVVNSTSCIFLKQQSKCIILLIILFICELIPKSSTRMNFLQVICNWSNWKTTSRYIITSIHIDSINVILDCLENILQGLRKFSFITKPFL